MSLTSRLARRFGVHRVNTELPHKVGQHTPALPNAAVMPLGGPPRRAVRADTSLPPRAAVRLPRAEAAASGMAQALASVHAGGPARAQGVQNTQAAQGAHGPQGASAQHVLLDSLGQAALDHGRLTRALFPSANQGFGMLTALAHELSRQDLSGVPPTPGLPGAPRVLMAQALAAATGGDATLALQALGALRELDPQRELAAAWRHNFQEARVDEAGTDQPPAAAAAPAAHAPEARQAAWRVAIALAGTPAGMDVLQHLVARPVDETRRRDLALLLKATAHLASARGAPTDPSSILADASARSTLAGRAVRCAAARMAGDIDAAHPHQWALTAVGNDLFDTGPGSAFAAIDARLMKMGRWVERATARKRWLRNPLVGKSPFRALKHGVQGVDRGPAIARHRAAREAALRNAASALKDGLLQMVPALRTPGPGQVPQALLRAAVIGHCLDSPAAQPLEREGFDADARTAIAERLARLLSPAAADSATGAQALQGLVDHLKEQPALRALATLRLDAGTLDHWFSEAQKTSTSQVIRSAAGTSPGGASGTEDAAGWASTVSDGLARARQQVDGRDTRVPEVTRDTVRAAVKDIIANIEGSSRLRLGSGGIVGAGLAKISTTVSGLASAFFLRGRLDARAQRGRQAVFEIAMPPYDMEMVIGTQRQRSRQVGVGAFVGPDLPGIVKAGVNADALLYGRDSAEISGVSLRLPRVGRPVPELRAEFSALVDTLLDGSEGGDQAGDETPLLQRLLQAFPDLTVNQIGAAGDGRRRHGLNVDAAASVGVPPAKFGASAGGFIEAQRDVTKHYDDATGRMRVARAIHGNQLKAGVGIKVSAGLGAQLASKTAASDEVDLSAGVLQTGISAERILSGVFDRREAVYEDGRLHPLSFVETEYNDVDTFLAAMAPQLDDWVDAGIERHKLDQLLADIKRYAAPNQTYAARCIVTPETRARDDVYRSALQLCAQHPGGMQDLAAELAQAIEAAWTDPAAVQPYSIRSYERNTVQATKGVDLVMQLASLETAEASHIDNRLDAPAQRPARPPRPAPESAPNPTLSRIDSDEFFDAQDFFDPEPESQSGPLDGEDKARAHTDEDEFFDAPDHLEPEHESLDRQSKTH